MGFLSKLIGGVAVQPIEAIGNVITGIWGDKGEKMTHKEVMAAIAQQPGMAQVEINKIEAQHRSPFVAGWRPFIGWVCGLGLLNAFIINPWITWVAELASADIETVPAVPLTAMVELVVAMLGLAGLRTYEKMQGRTK